MQSNSLKTNFGAKGQKSVEESSDYRAISLWLLGNPDGQCARRTI